MQDFEFKSKAGRNLKFFVSISDNLNSQTCRAFLKHWYSEQGLRTSDWDLPYYKL